jgi:hypothetical protein
MISSCSAWIVATMSAIRPVRLAPTAASSAASLVRPLAWAAPAARAASRSRISSSMPVTSRRRVRRCLRRRMPSGDAAVAV